MMTIFPPFPFLCPSGPAITTMRLPGQVGLLPVLKKEASNDWDEARIL